MKRSDGSPIVSASVRCHAGRETDLGHSCYHDRLAIAGNCRMCLVEVSHSTDFDACVIPVPSAFYAPHIGSLWDHGQRSHEV